MAHLQYMPGDPRLVDQLVYELKSKGIFDQFRKDCISDVDTRPAYQNLRQRVESSVALFLSRQTWKPDLNKNQLREKLRKHILDGNYLEQGVERIVDQVVNPKVASVFIPQVEDLVYNYLGITRKKSTPETSIDKGNASTDFLPTDLEAVSPGSVKSNDDKDEPMEETKQDKMDIDVDDKSKDLNDISMPSEPEQEKEAETQLSGISDLTSHDSEVSLGKLSIPMPENEEINLENIPSPENSPPKIDLDSIELPKEEPIELKDIPLPDESPKEEKEQFFKPGNSEDDSSSDSSIIRNMSPLTPIRNFNNENSCDAQQAFENDSDNKNDEKQEPNTFRFTIEAKSENDPEEVKEPKPEKEEQTDLAYQFSEQVNINKFNTPLYDDSSNSHNLQIDYESDVNSKTNLDKIPFPDDPNSEDSKKEATEEKRSHSSKSQSSHKTRDSHRHSSSSKDRRYDSKTSSSRDRGDPKHDKKTSKDDQSKSKSSSDKSKDRGDKKDSKDSKHRSSHKSSSSKDSKHRSSSSSQRHSSKTDDRKSSSSTATNKDKEKEKTSDKSSKEHRSSRDSKSRSDKDKKSKKDDKEKDKKDKKDTDDHYSASGRGNHPRRSTDRDSNDGSSSSKGSQNPSSSKSSESKANKGGSSKSDNTSPSSDSTSPSDKGVVTDKSAETNLSQSKPIVRVDTRLERPVATPPRLPFVPDVTLRKPKFAANLAEAKKFMKMRKFLDEEQKRMNQEAALLLEFQANVRPSLSQVYSSISGPELEFACISNVVEPAKPILETNYAEVQPIEEIADVPDSIEMELSEMNRETKEIVHSEVKEEISEAIEHEVNFEDSEQVFEPIEHKDNLEDSEQVFEPIEQKDNLEDSEEVFEPIEYKANFEDSEKILNEISRKVYGLINETEDENYEPELKPIEEVATEAIKNEHTEFEVTIITEEINENEPFEGTVAPIDEVEETAHNKERPLEYFAEHEKFDAELERDKFENFLKDYMTTTVTDKLYLINCDSYGKNIVKEVAETFGHYEIINYHKNGFKNKNIVKNVNVSNEIVLPLDRNQTKTPTELDTIKSNPISPMFSPVKSECSFELSSDYDAKLEEMVNKTSRQEIMEIILGGGLPNGSPSKMPQIDYCVDDNIERGEDLKRKMSAESSDNNNGQVLTPNKMRKLSDSDQISSTTEETPEHLNLSRTNVVRSKYLGKARRVGLPRPRRTVHPNSPSSDKSVENYDTNDSAPTPPNGKLKTQRKVQRYDTSDLYKPKLHYLSRRNNIS